MIGGCLSIPVVAVAAGFVFGEAYSEIWRPYAILVPAIAGLCVGEMLRHFLITRLERQREILVTTGAMLVVNGLLAVVGAAAFGLEGAAASTTVTYLAAAAGLVWYCARSLSVRMRELAVPRRSDVVESRGQARRNRTTRFIGHESDSIARRDRQTDVDGVPCASFEIGRRSAEKRRVHHCILPARLRRHEKGRHLSPA